MILTIKSATLEAGDYGGYIKVTGIDGKGNEVTKNIGEKFKDKWVLLDENATVDIKMIQRDKKWYVDGIEPVKIEVDGTKITQQWVEPPRPIKAERGAFPKEAFAPKSPQPKPATRYDNIDKRCALIQATELVKEGKIGIADWKRWADEFAKWLDGVI